MMSFAKAKLGFISLFTAVIVSCSSGTDTTDSSSAKTTPAETTSSKKTVALVMKTLTNPFFVQMEAGARRAEKELNINLLVKTAAQETSIQQQIDIVERLIDDGVDAIVIAPGDSIELIPALARAQKAGIAVVNIDNKLDADFAERNGMTTIPFISVDNEQSSYEATKYLTSLIDKPTKVAIIEGIKEAKNSQDRTNGALRAFNESNLVEVVFKESAHWKIDEAFNMAKEIYGLHPEVGAIFCANDMMALGVLEFLANTGRTDVLVVSYDALDDARKAVLAGRLVATVDQKPEEQGYIGVKTAMELINGQSVAATTLVDAVVINKANLDD